MDDATRGIANPLVEVVHFVRWGADVFHEATPSVDRLNPHLGFEFTELLGFADPRSRVNLRVRDGHGKFQDIIRSAAIALLQDHVDAMGIAEMIDPRSLVNTSGGDD